MDQCQRSRRQKAVDLKIGRRAGLELNKSREHGDGRGRYMQIANQRLKLTQEEGLGYNTSGVDLFRLVAGRWLVYFGFILFYFFF